MSLVKSIVPACQWVSEQSRQVKINRQKIPEYTQFILSKYPLVTQIDRKHHYVSADPRETAAYFIALDSINFGSGYFSIAKSCGVGLEYNVIADGLKKAFENREASSPEQWACVTPENMSHFLSVPLNKHSKLDELLELFSYHLQVTGKKICAQFQGNVLMLLEKADYSAIRLVDIVAAWETFRDVHKYNSCEIPILKRAQILAADLNLALPGKIKNIEELTIFADNMVPHVLRCDSILEYDVDLASTIDSGVPLLSGSTEEIEIRATAIYAVELMQQAAHQQGQKVTAVNLDHLLWHRGYEPDIYNKLSHRTLTVDY